MAKTGNYRKSRAVQRARRHKRIRKKVWGTAERPRLVVYRSLRNIEGQLVNDEESRTLIGLSTLDAGLRGFKGESDKNRRVQHAKAAGKALAARAKEKGIEAVVFDRGGYKYHGRVRAFAEGAREGGLKF
jgi:large subunit ribosomal protein L18